MLRYNASMTFEAQNFWFALWYVVMINYAGFYLALQYMTHKVVEFLERKILQAEEKSGLM